MFKCKIDLAEFDKNDKKVADPELNKTKALSKAAVKKLAAAPGEKTSFYLVKDYFENNGKAIGDFFALGTSKKLSKHFLMNELKGKNGIAMAKDAKSASMGEVYVKDLAGKNVLHFEPHDKSKLPSGQWPKVLKSLKGFFGGMKAVLVLGGQIIEAEEGGEEENETLEDNNNNTSTDTQKEAAPSVDTVVIDKIKGLMKDVADGMKNEITTSVVPNIKSKLVSNKDLDISVALLNKINELQQLYNSAEDKVKKALQPHVDKIVVFAPKLSQIKDAISKILGSTAPADGISAADKAALDELLKEAKDYLNGFQKDMGTLKKDIKDTASQAIEGGKALLNKLF